MSACLDHEHARRLLENAYAQWQRSLRRCCESSLHDAEAARSLLVATGELEERRCGYDRMLMLALPAGDLWAREDDPEWHLWLAWNRKLNAHERLFGMTRPGGEMDIVWQLCGGALLP
jgi:hypothetical protein